MSATLRELAERDRRLETANERVLLAVALAFRKFYVARLAPGARRPLVVGLKKRKAART